MGQSADATLAWGVVLTGDDDNIDYDDDVAMDAREALREKLDDFDDPDMDEILGWDEEFPGWPDHLRGLPLPQRDTDEYRAQEALIVGYQERHDNAVPFETDHYGTYDYGGKLLIIKRTKTWANWGVDTVDPASLTPPTSDERAKLNAVLDRLGFTGDREPRLLLFAMYG